MITTRNLPQQENNRSDLPYNEFTLRNIFDRITDAFVAFDNSWNYIYLNGKAAEIIGCKPEYLIGKNIWKEFPKKKEHHFYASFFTAMAEQRTLTEEGYCNPLATWLHATLYPSKEGLSVYLQDISAQKKVEWELEESREKYRQIVETAQEGIWMIDENHKTVFVNQKMCDILEYSTDEMMGKENTYFMDEEGRKLSSLSLERRRKGVTENIDKQFITKSGKYIWTNMSANPIFNKQGEYKGALAMISDISDKIKLQQQLMDEQMNKQKELIKAGMIAQEKERNKIGEELHDNINQLLTASRFFLAHSLETDDYKPYILKGRQCIGEAVEEIRKLSKELTCHAKVETLGLVSAITDLIDDVATVKKIKIRFIHNSYCEKEINNGLKMAIYRIVQEQINNILKHAEASEAIIVLKATQEDLKLRIKDNGKGFDMTAKKKGIGLANIRSRVDVYNGNLSIFSFPGKGCRIHVTFKKAK